VSNEASAFVSYSRSDSAFALRLAGDLKAAGVKVWVDQRDIVAGQRWDRVVEDAIRNCPLLLAVLSPASVNSTNVMDEVSFALEEHKTVIPIVYRECEIPFRLRRVQHVDFRVDYSSGLRELVRTLESNRRKSTALDEDGKRPEAAKVESAAASLGNVYIRYPGRDFVLDITVEVLVDGQLAGTGSLRDGIDLRLNIAPGGHQLQLERVSANFWFNLFLQMILILHKKDRYPFEIAPGGQYELEVTFSRFWGHFRLARDAD